MSDAIANVRRMIEGFASGKVDDAEEYIHDNYLNPDSLERSSSRGPASYRENVAWLRGVFSELHFDEISIEQGGDIVLARFLMSGRHTGKLFWMEGTGRRFAAEQLHLCHMVDGKVAAHRDWRDDLGCLRQLGLPKLPK
jgi:nogalonic acid methyl ester cyclase/aklanonic acid methyl ester cyclase